MRALLLALVLCSTPLVASAQRTETLRNGAYVRMVLHDGSKAKGFIKSVSDEKLELRVTQADATSTSVARSSIKWAEMEKRHPFRGAVKGGLFGLLIGGGVGYIVGAVTYDSSDCDILVCSANASGTLLGGLLGMLGLPIGALVGASRGDPEWIPVKPVAPETAP